MHMFLTLKCFVIFWINYALTQRSFPDNLQFIEDSVFPLYFTRNKNNQRVDL